MKKIALAVIALLLLAFIDNNGGIRLGNGRYYMQYDEEYQYKGYWLKIKGNRAIIWDNKQKKEWQINWIRENEFRFTSEVPQQDSLVGLEKQLNSLGLPYYELTERRKDTIFFTFRRNPHIVLNSGMFIRKR